MFKAVLGKMPQRSVINLSHEKKLTMKFGQLYPVMLEEMLPGDEFKVESETMVRLAPMISPVMHRIDAYIHYFFVPNRILWDDWEDFITGKEELVVPTKTIPNANVEAGSIYDYMGIPTTAEAGSVTFNSLPFRAYNAIFHEYYRDQNLITEFDYKNDANINAAVHFRAWEKDYFTSCLPWAQKGEAASLPINHNIEYKEQSEVNYTTGGTPATNLTSLGTDASGKLMRTPGPGALRLQNINDIEAAIEINELREASAVQRWLEKNARAGSRYIETILSHFGVVGDDARLQRPEYLGGGKAPVVVSEVVNNTGFTSDEANALPQGTLAGHGLSVGKTNRCKKYAKEHGYLIGIMSVMPRTAYMDGLPRKFSRETNYDFYWPEFANLGEQEVLRKEVKMNGVTTDEETFGYQERYAEYKHALSTVHGDFRTTLDFWHLARKNTGNTLNSQFISCNASDRIFAVQDGTDYLWTQVYNKVIAKRPMPKHSIPTL